MVGAPLVFHQQRARTDLKPSALSRNGQLARKSNVLSGEAGEEKKKAGGWAKAEAELREVKLDFPWSETCTLSMENGQVTSSVFSKCLGGRRFESQQAYGVRLTNSRTRKMVASSCFGCPLPAKKGFSKKQTRPYRPRSHSGVMVPC